MKDMPSPPQVFPFGMDVARISRSDGNAARTVYEVRKSVASEAMGSKDTNNLKISCGERGTTGK